VASDELHSASGREHDDSVAEVDGVEDRGENADVGLGSGDNQALDPTPAQKVAQFRLGKWRIHPLADHLGTSTLETSYVAKYSLIEACRFF
jgi:hypothetical protein